MKALIALSILLLSSSAFAGETCTLTGTVVSASNRPVPSAVVLTDSRSPSTQVDYTQADGRFRFRVDPAGRQQVTVVSVGRVPAVYEVDCKTVAEVTTVLP
jgi:hypothetical protein